MLVVTSSAPQRSLTHSLFLSLRHAHTYTHTLSLPCTRALSLTLQVTKFVRQIKAVTRGSYVAEHACRSAQHSVALPVTVQALVVVLRTCCSSVVVVHTCVLWDVCSGASSSSSMRHHARLLLRRHTCFDAPTSFDDFAGAARHGQRSY